MQQRPITPRSALAGQRAVSLSCGAAGLAALAYLVYKRYSKAAERADDTVEEASPQQPDQRAHVNEIHSRLDGSRLPPTQPWTNKRGYNYCSWPPAKNDDANLQPGQRVYVKLKSDRDTGRATTVAHAGNTEQRIQVEYDTGGSYLCRRSRLTQQCATAQTVVVCATTDEFRALCRSQTLAGERCIDVGSSWGLSTAVLAEMVGSGNCMGIDVSEEAVAAASTAYPEIRFQVLNALENVAKFIATCQEFNATFFAVDIGGDRATEALSLILPLIEEHLQPRMIVVKARNLHRNAEKHRKKLETLVAPGLIGNPIPDCAQWWDALEAEAHAAAAKRDSAGQSRFRFHPLYYPAKAFAAVPEGETHKTMPELYVCRFHNFGSCMKSSAQCPHDHTRCYVCLGTGHTAQSCSQQSEFGVSDNLAIFYKNAE